MCVSHMTTRLIDLVLPICHLCSRDQTEVLKHGDRYFDQLNDLTGPSLACIVVLRYMSMTCLYRVVRWSKHTNQSDRNMASMASLSSKYLLHL